MASHVQSWNLNGSGGTYLVTVLVVLLVRGLLPYGCQSPILQEACWNKNAIMANISTRPKTNIKHKETRNTYQNEHK